MNIIDILISIIANINFLAHSVVVINGVKINAFVYYDLLPAVVCLLISIPAGILLYKLLEKIKKH